MAKFSRGGKTNFTVEGKRNQEILDKVDDLTDRLDALGSGGSLTVAEPCTPDFAISYTPKKSRLRATFCAEIPVGSQIIGAIIIADEFYNVDQDTFDANKIDAEVDIEPDASDAGHVEWLFPPLLDFDTTYHLMRLIVTDDGGVKYRNPPRALVFNSPSLADFTTPADALAPNRPHVGNIIENNLDDATSRKFDAWLTVQIIAPPSASNNITGTVTVTINSVTVSGSGTSFLTAFSVGNGIEVNGETHIVATIPSNISLTVDYAFKQATASGQTATRKVLMTFDEANYQAVVPKFRATNDTSEDKAISSHFAIDETNGTQTNVKVKVPGLFAARKYDYRHNVGVGYDGRHTSSPLATQTFIAGNFTDATNGIPEWTTAPFFQYDATDPQNDNKRAVSLRITQTSPPVAMDKIRLYKRNTGTGTISGSTTTITGSGTAFLTELAKGHFIIASGQTLEVSNIASDTSLTVLAAPSPSISGVAWTKSVLVDDFSVQIGKFHPSAGGLVPPIKFGEIKTKKLVALTYAAEIYPLNGATFRTITDSFTPDGEAADDTGVPSGLSTPVLSWSAEGKLKIQGMQATTNAHTMKKRYVVLHNNAGTYFNLVTRAVAANEAAARYEIGSGHLTMDWVKLKRLRNVFGTGSPTNVYAYWYGANDFESTLGVSAASSNSNAIDLTSQYDFMDGNSDTVGGLSPGTQAISTVNVVYNGHFTYGTATDLQLWQRRDKTTWATVNTIDTDTGDDVYWDKNNHRIVWQDEAERFTVSIGKRQIPGDYYTVSALVKSNGTPVVDIECIIRDNAGNNDTADDLDITVNPTVSVTLSSTYQFLVWRMRLRTGADASVKHHLSFETASAAVDSSNQIIVDAVMMVRGKTAAAFSFHPKDQNNAGGGDEDFDVTAANTGVTFDLGNPVGTDGGYPATGEGRAIPL